jgi:hypothetical protein
MTAATTADNIVLAAHKEKLLGSVRNLVLDENFNTAVPFIFADNFTIPTTSIDDVGDIRRLYLFPSGAYLTDLRVTAAQLDTNATPTLVFSIVVTKSDDSVQDTLISSSTIGQAGGTARVANTGVGQFVGDRYLALKVGTAAATAHAATLGVYVQYAVGINSYQAAGPFPILTDVAV